MAKLLYIAERKPGFSDQAFVARWRRHGALAMSLPMWANFRRYVQSSVIRPAPAAGASDAYDAVGVMWLHAPPPADDPQHLADVAVLAQDEFETFAYPIAPVCLPLDETLLIDGPEARTTAYAFFSDPAAARRLAESAAAVSSGAGPDRVALNTATGDLAAGGVRLPYRAVVEIAAQDALALDRSLAELGPRPLSVADLAVVGRDAILWG